MPGTGATGAGSGAVDRVVGVARAAGLAGQVEVTAPTNAAHRVGGHPVDTTWPVHLDAVVVDPRSGTVTARSGFPGWPLLAQLSKLGVRAHMGYLFGPVNQILLAALAVGPLCVVVWDTGCGGNAAPPAPTAPPHWLVADPGRGVRCWRR
ncbi:MAG: hypothetical protein V7603_3178 [Micromonosporaceae bacterium]